MDAFADFCPVSQTTIQVISFSFILHRLLKQRAYKL